MALHQTRDDYRWATEPRTLKFVTQPLGHVLRACRVLTMTVMCNILCFQSCEHHST
jgi:hypothetical protein